MAEGMANALATADVTADVDEAAAFIKFDPDVERNDDCRARSSISYKSEIESTGDTSDDSSEAIDDPAGVRCELECSESGSGVCLVNWDC